MDWFGARILRFLYLCDRRIPGFSSDLLPLWQPYRRHCCLTCHLRRRLCCPPDRRLCAWSLGRHAWPQDRVVALHVPDGLLDDGGWPVADLPSGRNLGTGAARCAALDPGICGCRRNLRSELDDTRARALWAARLFCELHHAGRASRPIACGGGVPAICTISS